MDWKLEADYMKLKQSWNFKSPKETMRRHCQLNQLKLGMQLKLEDSFT